MQDMQIEVVAFYPYRADKKKLLGTLHVYIVIAGVEIDLRGIDVFYEKKAKDHWFFSFPQRRTWDHEEKKEALYPIFHFTNGTLDANLRKLIRDEGIKHIQKKFLDKGLFKPMKPPKFGKRAIKEKESTSKKECNDLHCE